MANINLADGSSIKAIYDFLLSIPKKDFNATVTRFVIQIEDNVTLKRRQEAFNTVDEFLTRFEFVLSKISPQCDVGPYFRLTQITISADKNGRRQTFKYFYDTDNMTWRAFHSVETKTRDDEFWLSELEAHSDRQEFLIAYRKGRYVDPCYVDEDYIDEKYEQFYSNS